MTTPTVHDILADMVEASVDPRFAAKVDRMKKQYSDEELARFLWDRGALPAELERKYGLNKVMSNVSASEIPEEAPDYVGDIGTAEAAGLKPPSTSAEAPPDELEDLDNVDGEELTANSPRGVLEEEARTRGLSISGNRQDIFDRIVEYDAEHSED